MTTEDNKPKAAEPPLTELTFAYPFNQPGGKAFTDEHEVRALLREESAGSYLVGQSGLWHGGIHISEGGAGKRLDLSHGVRCIANGEVVAYRINKTYPTTEMPARDTKPAVSAPFSTGFALVRHSMEYPRGQKLCFFTLYMHLLNTEEYEKYSELQMPAYWDMEYQVTDGALDRPEAHLATGEPAPATQVGLRVRAGAGHAKILAILPQLSKVRIGETKLKGQWGQLIDADVGSMYAPRLGDSANPVAANGWIFLGKEKGEPVVTRVLADAQVDCVVVLKKPFPINAGDLIGHMGQYDPLDGQISNNRIVHVEAFCDDSVEAYLTQSRAYVDEHAKDEDHTIVRIGRSTKLYEAMGKEGANAPLTGVVAVYPVSVLASGPKEQQTLETVTGSDKKKAHWWKIDSADGRLAPISGWVRETNHPQGRVTLEAPHQWIDFQVLQQEHDPTHTMFTSASAFMDYRLQESVPDVAALSKLSPLAGEIYRVAFPTGAGANAADELPSAYTNEWRQLALSRLVVKHESEWANAAKWDALFAEMAARASANAELAEERKRIDKLVWWDDVAGKVEGFPSSPEVFHLNPVALVGNFNRFCDCAARFRKISPIILRHEGGYVNDPSDSGGATNKGIAWPAWTAYAKEDLGIEPTLSNLKNITDEQAEKIYLKRYWEPQGFCRIANDRIALMIYDWTITSGRAVRKVKELLNESYATTLLINNHLEPNTIDALNEVSDQDDLLNKIATARKKYYTSLTVDKNGKPTKNIVFIKGWLNRVDDCLGLKL